MEATGLRLRLVFDDPEILSKSQKKDGLKRSWVLLKPHLHAISDVVSFVLRHFDLFETCPKGITLSIDGFVLPPFESTTILKDRDLIRVKKKGTKLCDFSKAIEGAEASIKDVIVDKKSLPSGILFMENEEHDKMIGGYERKTDADEVDVGKAQLPVDNGCNGDVATKKRKASNTNESSKAKRRCMRKPNTVQDKRVHHEAIRTPQESGKIDNGNESKQDSLFDPKVTVKCTKYPETTSDQKKFLEPEINREKGFAASGAPDGAKKVNRNSMRKRFQRKLKREHRSKDKNNQLDADSRSKKDLSSHTLKQADEDSDADGDLVPVVIRPGHIRFTASGKASDLRHVQEANVWNGISNEKSVGGGHKSNKSSWDVHSTQKSVWESHSSGKTSSSVQKDQVLKDNSQWNASTNKRKGQKWGTGKQPTSSWKESNSSGSWVTRKQAFMDFEKLVPLIDLPKAGDIVAYRLLEISSSSQCPQLSSFRIGKISSFETKSNMIMLVPDPDYPFNFQKKGDYDNHASGIPAESSVYNEDGSLEIDFPSLVDVRIVKRGDLSYSAGNRIPAVNGSASSSGKSKMDNGTLDGWKKVPANVCYEEVQTPTPANMGKDVWEAMTEALSAKKAQYTQEDSWNKKKVSSSTRSWSQRTLRGRALGPAMAMPRAPNGT